MEIKGWMPIPPDSTVLTNEEMTDLRALGISEIKNMRLPKDLADKIHAARIDATNRKLQLQPGATFDPSQIVNIEDLPDAHKRALKNYITQSQPILNAEAEVQQQVNVIVPNNPGIMPNLTKAMEVAASASVAVPAPPPVVNRPGVVVMTPPPVTRIHNPPPPPPPNNPPKVVVPVPAAWSQSMNTSVPATPKVQSAPPAAPPVPMPTMEEQPYFINPPAAVPASAAATPVPVTVDDFKNTTEPVEDRCPRCAFDRKKNKLVEEPTHNDLIEYRAQTVIGGHRYYKEYLTFGGQLRITFRTLTQKEEDYAVIQVVRDGQNNLNNDILVDDYLRSQKRYRMIMSIDKITRGDNVIQLSPYENYDQEKTLPDKDRLKTFYDQVLESTLTSSSLFNVVQEKFDNFDSYVAVMELRADDPKSYPTTQQQ